MSQATDSNKRVLKNTFFLYIRMLITLVVSLYTSRVVLNTLGVADYGIYNIVGSVVALFGFLNSTMSGATQRFFTTEIGKNDKKQLSVVFCSAIQIHALISLIVLVLSETVGVWILYNKLNIPIDRYDAAMWVLQCSIFSSVVMIMSVPYNAAIIAHERMGAFAYISILEVLLKLIVVFALLLFCVDKLKLYATLMLCTQILIRIVYSMYCKRNFPETSYKRIVDKTVFREMSSFAGWDLYGNLCVIGKTQGLNFLLNIFFGTALNAAAGIANQVTGVIMQFASNIVMAIRPQIMICYVQKNFRRMNYLINRGSWYIYLLILMLASPFLIDCYYVLNLWLGLVPDYAVPLCRISLLYGMLTIINSTVLAGIHATGKIKKISFISGSIQFLVVVFTYVAFKMGAEPYWAYGISVIILLLTLFINGIIFNSLVKEFSLSTYMKLILQVVCVTILYLSILSYSSEFMEISFSRLITLCGESVALAVLLLMLTLTNEEKEKIKAVIRRRLLKTF